MRRGGADENMTTHHKAAHATSQISLDKSELARDVTVLRKLC